MPSLFGRDDDKDEGSSKEGDKADASKQPEGVRLIEPEKVAEVAEKDTTAKRRGGDIPKYGDRPASPPSDKKAAIRLPLPSGATDLTGIERPKVAPVNRPQAEGSAGEPPTRVSIGAPAVGTGDAAPPTAAPPTAPKPPDEGSRKKRKKERKSRVEEATAPPLDLPELEKLDDGSATSPDSAAPPTSDTGSQPLLSVEPPTGEVSMPHWTEPATGEVPQIIIGDAPEDDSDQAAWDSFAGTAGPRYRDEHDNWDDSSITDLLDDDDEARLGALAADEVDPQTQDDFLTLEDLEMPSAEMPRPPTRGSVSDPVRQGKAGRATSDSQAQPAPRATKRVSKRPADPAGAGGTRAREREREQERERSSRGGRTRRPDDTGDNKTVVERLGVAAPQGPGEGGGRNIKMAVAIGLPMGLVAWAILGWDKVPRWIGLIVITAVVFLAGAEFLAAVGTRRFKPVLPVGWAALLALPIATYASGEVAIPLVLFLTVLFSFLWYVMGLATEKPLGNLGVTFFAVLWVGMFGSFASLIYRIKTVQVDGIYTDGDQGPSILIMAIAASVASDAGALLWGKLYGKRTFTPISPNKTIEGLIGGVLTAVVIITIAGVKFGPFSTAGDIFFAFCCAVAAPLGDLAESLIKRDIGLKDMSDLIPGHGGVLDRFDALLFVLPVAYFVTRLLLPGIPYI